MSRQHHTTSAWQRRLFLAFPPLAAIVLALMLVVPARAATTTNIRFPLADTVFNPCNGEVVTFSGVVHLTRRATVDSRGGSMVASHFNIHVTGVGDQGNTYVGNEEEQDVVNSHVGSEETFSHTFLLISRGSAPNFVVHTLVHITVNANGTETATVGHFSTTCRG